MGARSAELGGGLGGEDVGALDVQEVAVVDGELGDYGATAGFLARGHDRSMTATAGVGGLEFEAAFEDSRGVVGVSVDGARETGGVPLRVDLTHSVFQMAARARLMLVGKLSHRSPPLRQM